MKKSMHSKNTRVVLICCTTLINIVYFCCLFLFIGFRLAMDQQSVNTGHIHQVQTHQQAPQQQMQQQTNGQQFVNSIKPDLRYVPTQSYLAQTVKDPLTEGLKILDKVNVQVGPMLVTLSNLRNVRQIRHRPVNGLAIF